MASDGGLGAGPWSGGCSSSLRVRRRRPLETRRPRHLGVSGLNGASHKEGLYEQPPCGIPHMRVRFNQSDQPEVAIGG